MKHTSVALPESEYLQRVGEVAYATAYLEWTLLGNLNCLSDRLPDKFSLDVLEQKTMGRISSMKNRPPSSAVILKYVAISKLLLVH